MVRRLSPDEQALWSRVAASVRPLPGRRVAATPPTKPTAPKAAAVAPPAPRSTVAAPAPRVSVAAATLDGGWDRRLTAGQAHPDMTVDLHGHTLDAAHARLDQAIDIALAAGDRVLLVVTGKGRAGRPGLIRAELGHWIDLSRHRTRIAALRPAHRRHGGGGAFYLVLRRARA